MHGYRDLDEWAAGGGDCYCFLGGGKHVGDDDVRLRIGNGYCKSDGVDCVIGLFEQDDETMRYRPLWS